ncbi:hypothetical protein [Rhodococcus opacus]|uniref:Uncharacterized protein n=1 Tax=Rhodococcus opacus TaxID=37919 RepID=A0A076EVF8_RHOOP|nr:hypothetical protein EP51_36075 [Rhodococcus opacus]
MKHRYKVREAARRRAVRSPDHCEQQCLPRRAGTGDGVPRRTAKFGTDRAAIDIAEGDILDGGVTGASAIRVVTRRTTSREGAESGVRA